MGLFVVNAAMAATGLPQHLIADLKAAGLDLDAPLTLFLVICALSNIVGNNPAVMLLIPYLGTTGDRDALGAALALGTGFSSNMIVFGSLAGIIVVEQARARGIAISFAEFARAGLPVAARLHGHGRRLDRAHRQGHPLVNPPLASRNRRVTHRPRAV